MRYFAHAAVWLYDSKEGRRRPKEVPVAKGILQPPIVT